MKIAAKVNLIMKNVEFENIRNRKMVNLNRQKKDSSAAEGVGSVVGGGWRTEEWTRFNSWSALLFFSFLKTFFYLVISRVSQQIRLGRAFGRSPRKAQRLRLLAFLSLGALLITLQYMSKKTFNYSSNEWVFMKLKNQLENQCSNLSYMYQHPIYYPWPSPTKHHEHIQRPFYNLKNQVHITVSPETVHTSYNNKWKIKEMKASSKTHKKRIQKSIKIEKLCLYNQQIAI